MDIQGKCALFFDVDDTLLGKDHKLVESAKDAIEKARANGHLCFINSGRCYSMLHTIEETIDMDGLLCGCGTEIRMNGERSFIYEIPTEVQRSLTTADLRYRCGMILEGSDWVHYRTDEKKSPLIDEMRVMAVKMGIVPDMPYESEYPISKFCFQVDGNSDLEGIYREYGEDFEIIDRGGNFYEAVPRGYSKGEVIRTIAKQCDIPMENTFVFGDSSNDLSMFEVANYAIAMQEHDPILDKYATYITDTPENDGIKKALEHYNLI